MKIHNENSKELMHISEDILAVYIDFLKIDINSFDIDQIVIEIKKRENLLSQAEKHVLLEKLSLVIDKHSSEGK